MRDAGGQCEWPLTIPNAKADDHHAFHEDAKRRDLTGQLGTRGLLPRLMKQVRESVSK